MPVIEADLEPTPSIVPIDVFDMSDDECLARLIGIRVDMLDRHHASDRGPAGGGEGLDVVCVVAHTERLRQSTFRHDR